MLRALINSMEPGRICEVRNPGEEFEVHESFSWVDVPDDTTTQDTYLEDGTVKKYSVIDDPYFVTDGYKVARAIGYGSIGDQLDMLYKEIKAVGGISPTGPWVTHIESIKAAIPKDDPQAVHDWNVQWVSKNIANSSPI